MNIVGQTVSLSLAYPMEFCEDKIVHLAIHHPPDNSAPFPHNGGHPYWADIGFGAGIDQS